jgi:carbonic anhydrase
MSMRSRRLFLLCAVSCLAATGALAAHPAAHPAADPESVPADEALTRMLEGNHRFVQSVPMHPDQDPARRFLLASGQAPMAIVLCCSDSRVPPEVVFDQGLGNLFVVRVAGNVANQIGIASLEYAAEHLGTRLIVVLGHERCGALTAAVKGGELPGHLPALMTALQPAVAAKRDARGDPVEGAIRANIELNVEQLRESAPILSELVEKGELKIVGARYDLDTGIVEWIDTSGGAAHAPPAAHAATGAKPAGHAAAPAANHGAPKPAAGAHH